MADDSVKLTIKEKKGGGVVLKIRRCGPRQLSEKRPAAGAGHTLLTNETHEAAVARGMRTDGRFEYRGVSVGYSELPDADTNLLFGNALWPAAETLSRLLVDEARGGAKVWTEGACAQIGVPLEALLRRRFGVEPSGPPPSPGALASLGIECLLPDLSSDGPMRGGPMRDGAMRDGPMGGGPMRVLEVGAGVGVTGLVCNALGADVTLTDGEARLVEALSARHGGEQPRLHFATLDWTEYLVGGGHLSDPSSGDFDVVIGVELLSPACEGEVYVPRVIARRLRRRRGSRALLLGEVRGVDTCRSAVGCLLSAGLCVAAFAVCNGRELYEVGLDELVPVGGTLLLVATWGPLAP